jgi:hypothetical protein
MSDSNKISRRTALKAGMTVLAGGLVATAAHADDDPDIGKQSKESVQYKYHWAANGNHCAICANFLAIDNPENPTHKDNRCKLVAGVIDPNGVCNAFAKKKKAA